MKARPLSLKIIVLSFFILLIAGFVAYRSGAFQAIFVDTTAPSANALASNSMLRDVVVDSPPAARQVPALKEWKRRTMISSSKSLILTDDSLTESLFKSANGRRLFYLDTTPVAKEYRIRPVQARLDSGTISKDDSTRERYMMMSGSKSAPVIKPRIYLRPKNEKD